MERRSTGWQESSGANSSCPTCRCAPFAARQEPQGAHGLCCFPLIWRETASLHVSPSGRGEGGGPGGSACSVPGWVTAAGSRDAPAFGPPHLRRTNWVSSLSFPAFLPSPALPKLVFWPSITPATGKGAA